jgi:hypothetical protein
MDPQLSQAGASIWKLANWFSRSEGLESAETCIFSPARSSKAAVVSEEEEVCFPEVFFQVWLCAFEELGAFEKLCGFKPLVFEALPLEDFPLGYLLGAVPCPLASPLAVVAAGLRFVSSSPSPPPSLLEDCGTPLLASR